MNAELLKRNRERFGLTQEQLADLLQSSRKTINSYENGASIPKSKMLLLENIFSQLENEGTMLKGEESPIPKNIVEERDVLSYSKGIPYYNVDFINGFTGVEEITHQNAEYNIDYPPANHCQFWVNATGESMKGIIDNGDKIALKQVDTEWFPLGEVYAIVTTNGHRMVKKIVKSENNECYKLISANPDKTEYPDQDIPKKMIHTLFKVVTTIKFVN